MHCLLLFKEKFYILHPLLHVIIVVITAIKVWLGISISEFPLHFFKQSLKLKCKSHESRSLRIETVESFLLPGEASDRLLNHRLPLSKSIPDQRIIFLRCAETNAFRLEKQESTILCVLKSHGLWCKQTCKFNFWDLNLEIPFISISSTDSIRLKLDLRFLEEIGVNQTALIMSVNIPIKCMIFVFVTRLICSFIHSKRSQILCVSGCIKSHINAASFEIALLPSFVRWFEFCNSLQVIQYCQIWRCKISPWKHILPAATWRLAS